MHKIIFLPIAFAAISFSSFRNSVTTEQDPPDSDTSWYLRDNYGTGEDSLHYGELNCNTNVYLYDASDSAKGVTGFHDHFKYQNKLTDLINEPESVQLSQLLNLYKDIRQQYAVRDYNVVALRNYYGLENGSMALIFQPILLKKDSTSKVDYAQTEINEFYRMRGGALVKITKGKKDTMTSNFIDSVYIIHINTSNTRFIDDSRFAWGDTKYAVTPLQQILRMAGDNNAALSDTISFLIIANNHYMTGGRHIKNYKLHVMAYIAGKVTNNSYSNGFQGYAADFDQMCPPKCNDRIRLNYYLWNTRAICARRRTSSISTKSSSIKNKTVNIETQ